MDEAVTRWRRLAEGLLDPISRYRKLRVVSESGHSWLDKSVSRVGVVLIQQANRPLFNSLHAA